MRLKKKLHTLSYKSLIMTGILAMPLVLSACNSDDAHTKKTDTRPVADQPPYWCQLVPQDSLSRVTAVSRETRQIGEIDTGQPYSRCEVRSPTQEPLMAELASGERAKFLASDEFRRPRSRISLPSNLGKAGYASLAGNSAYTVFSEIRCDKAFIWIEITVRPITKGRNPARDLAALLQIAENRYAKLANCSINQP